MLIASDTGRVDMGSDRTMDFQGHQLWLRYGGEGPALLLIHGFPTCGADWDPLWAALERRYRLYAIDMLGFGRSDKPLDFHYSIAASADQWQALVQQQGLREVAIVAHDYGVTVAQELLARQREGGLSFHIRQVVFLNGGLFPEATYPLLLQKLLLGRLGALVARLSSYRSFAVSLRRICAHPLDEAWLRQQWAWLVQADGRRVMPRIIQYIRERRTHRERWVGALRGAGVPVHLINGVEDPVSGRSIISRWRELLPQAPVVELDGVGHYPQVEAPERVLDALQAVLLPGA